jgi:hypothetical protein
MGPDPEPQDVLTLTDADGPVPQTDARREDGTSWMNLFELKARMGGIDSKRTVGSSGPALDVRWEAPKRFPEALIRVRVHILSGSIGLVRPAR